MALAGLLDARGCCCKRLRGLMLARGVSGVKWGEVRGSRGRMGALLWSGPRGPISARFNR